MNKKILPIIAVLASAALSARAQNFVVNGGFEAGDLTGWTISGDTSFTGVGTDNPHSGNYEFFSGPTSSDGFLDQTIPTLADTSYQLEFWLSNNNSSGNNRFGVTFGGLTLVPEGVFPYFPNYTLFTFANVVPGANADLHFIFYNPPGFFYLDDVSVNVVPEPGTLGLVALGAIGLVGAVRKRRFV
jgi:PEP-CTERM motif